MDRKKHVMLVDDEPGILKVVGLFLKLHSYEVTTCNDGEKAVDLVRKQEPDVILLDILMPGISGLDVIERVRAFSRVPIIAFTANHQTVDSAMKLGANGAIGKPFDPEHMLDRIEFILKGATL